MFFNYLLIIILNNFGLLFNHNKRSTWNMQGHFFIKVNYISKINPGNMIIYLKK